MKTYLPFIALLLAFASTSCQKEDLPATDLSGSGLLKEILYGDEVGQIFTYTEAGKIMEEKSKWFYTKHHYVNGRLVTTDYFVDPQLYSSAALFPNRKVPSG